MNVSEAIVEQFNQRYNKLIQDFIDNYNSSSENKIIEVQITFKDVKNEPKTFLYKLKKLCTFAK